MKKIKYELKATKYNFSCSVQFNEKIPQFILDLATKALCQNKTIETYVSNQGILGNSDLYRIIKRAFKNYQDVYSTSVDNIQMLIENGYITREENITGIINSLQPVVNKFTMTVDNKEWNLYTEEDTEEALIEMMENKYPEGFDFKVSSIVPSAKIMESIEVDFEIKNKTLYCKGDEIIEKEVDYDLLAELNQLPIFINATRMNNIEDGYGFIDEEDFSIMDQYEDIFYQYEIKDSSIIFNEYKNWMDLLMCKTSIIRQSEFTKDSKEYQIIYHDYLNKNITLNKFIFLTFIKNEKAIRSKLIESPKVGTWINDEAILRNLLLIDEDFKMPSNINIQYTEKILHNASLEQMPIIMDKLSIEQRDNMTSPKLLNRLASINKDYLSPKQLKIVQDEEAKKQIIIDEYHSVIGKITNLGIREKIKSLTKKELKTVGGKKTKQWLDKNIGHNKGDQEINETSLKKARGILKVFENIKK